MKKFNLLLFTILTSIQVFSQTTYTYDGIGNWNDEANWSPSYPGTNIDAVDEVIIAVGSEVESNGLTFNGNVTNNGSVTTSSIVNINGELINNGEWTSRSFLNINGIFINNGQWTSNSSFNVNGTSATNYGTFHSNSSFQIHTGKLFTNNGVFNSNSLFTVNDGSTFRNNDKATFNSITRMYGEFVNTAALNVVYIFENYGILNNTGSINENARFAGSNISHTSDHHLNNRLNPLGTDSDFGTYLFNDNLSMGVNARVQIQVGRNNTNDVVTSNKTITLWGRLEVSLEEYEDIDENDVTFDPEIGDTFTIVTANQINGTFSAIIFPEMVGKEFQITYNDNNIVLEVVEKSVLSAAVFQTSKLNVYPNPTDSKLSIDGISSLTEITIINSLGQELINTTIGQGDTIDLSGYPSGIYFLRTENNETLKIIKE